MPEPAKIGRIRYCKWCGEAFIVVRANRRQFTCGGHHGCLNRPPEDYFWPHVKKSDGCWEWTGGIGRAHGYGVVHVGGRKLLAHRHSHELHIGPIPDGLDVCHTCDNRPCVRPDHLYAGTRKQNVGDMIARGRQNYAIGENAADVKLTADQVREIRERYARGGISLRAIAREYGVEKTTVRSAITRVTWRHVA